MYKRGFSIAEMLVVIFILTLFLYGFTLGISDSLKREKQRAMTYSVKNSIEWVRVYSILKGEKLKIKFFPDYFNVYTYQNRKWKFLKRINFPGLELRANNSPIFYPYGTVSNLFTLYVEKNGFIRKITMNINGKITIK